MIVGHHDFETASTIDLQKCGAHRYAEDLETRVWCMSWRLGDGPIQRWHPGDTDPIELLNHVRAGGMLCSHNSTFERCIWNITLRSQAMCAHWPKLEIAQQNDTMARSLAVHLPAALGQLGTALGLAERKDEEGARLMKKMAKPRKIYSPEAAQTMVRPNSPEWTSRPDGTLIQWWNSAENIQRLGTYCDQDVATECEVDNRLPQLSAEERALWKLDQRINDRGVALDIATIERIVGLRQYAIKQADAEIERLTEGVVTKLTQSTRIVTWLRSRGVECDSISKDEHDEIKVFSDCIGNTAARAVIELRANATKTSTAKYKKMLDYVCADGRARGLHMFHRAGTGRFGGAGVQAQNLPRVDEELHLPYVLSAIDTLEMCGE